MIRKFGFLLAVLLAFALGVPDVPVVGGFQAHAQENPAKPKNLFDLLFGGALRKNRQPPPRASAPPKAKRVKIKPRKTQRKKAAKKSRPAKQRSQQQTAKAAAPPKKVEKNADAATILVIGDFMAGHLYDGLRVILAENPAVQLVDRSVALSGLVRDDVHDWPNSVGAMIETVKPVAVIALVGMNDRQMIRTSGGGFNKLTDAWKSEYERRVDRLARETRERQVPMIWVGLPPVSRSSMNADYLVFNEYYRTTVETYGGLFVDVWDGFSDDNGRYVRSGPDVNGQIVALRTSDGINMTRNGKEKLGFYAEKAVKRVTGFGKDALLASADVLAEPAFADQSLYDPAGTGETMVIALGSPAADGGVRLEGSEGFLKANDAGESNSYALVAKGIAAQPKRGRVDSAWGKPTFDLAQSETPEPVLANRRGISFKSSFDEFADAPAPVTN